MVKYVGLISLQLSADYSRMWIIVFVGVCSALFGVKGDVIDSKKSLQNVISCLSISVYIAFAKSLA